MYSVYLIKSKINHEKTYIGFTSNIEQRLQEHTNELRLANAKQITSLLKFSGVYSCGETPVPIPNTVVKSTAPIILGW